MKTTNKKESLKPRVHAEIGKFNVSVSSFGEIESTIDIDNLNSFLNRNVEDKKLSKDQVSIDKN